MKNALISGKSTHSQFLALSRRVRPPRAQWWSGRAATNITKLHQSFVGLFYSLFRIIYDFFFFNFYESLLDTALTHTSLSHTHASEAIRSAMNEKWRLARFVCIMHAFFRVHFANDLMIYNRLTEQWALACDVRIEFRMASAEMTTGRKREYDAKRKLNGPDTVANIYEFIISRICCDSNLHSKFANDEGRKIGHWTDTCTELGWLGVR